MQLRASCELRGDGYLNLGGKVYAAYWIATSLMWFFWIWMVLRVSFYRNARWERKAMVVSLLTAITLSAVGFSIWGPVVLERAIAGFPPLAGGKP